MSNFPGAEREREKEKEERESARGSEKCIYSGILGDPIFRKKSEASSDTSGNYLPFRKLKSCHSTKNDCLQSEDILGCKQFHRLLGFLHMCARARAIAFARIDKKATVSK